MGCHKGNKSCAIPVLRDKEHVYSSRCKAPRGGAKTAGVPEYVLKVINLPDPNVTN
jgi:hypothetical protein